LITHLSFLQEHQTTASQEIVSKQVYCDLRNNNYNTTTTTTLTMVLGDDWKIKRILVANRGEIAIRIIRACEQLGIEAIAIYSYDDRLNIHRYKAKKSFQVGKGLAPVAAYLQQDEIIALAVREKVDAIHPGYGFLSESAEFAAKCQEAGIIWIGPKPHSMEMLGDKAKARQVAKDCGVAIVPGTEGEVPNAGAALEFVKAFGLPVILKACFGGGGRGCRVVRKESELVEAFQTATSEAKASFGNGALLIEKLVERPRHVEIQVFGDKQGNLVHMFERDCSVQRRHQKVIEIAPAHGLAQEVLERMYADALKLSKHCDYQNAGTVEFLVDQNGKDYYFIEVNPRVQVEHTITEATTGIDIVESQIMVAGGKTLEQLGLQQHQIHRTGHAIQCRITTEDPEQGFRPDCGRVLVYRSVGGPGIRLDGNLGYVGANISAFYDSLLVKVTTSGATWETAVRRTKMALSEMRIKGVVTNIPFLENVLGHPEFAEKGHVWTTFIDDTPALFEFPQKRRDRKFKVINYLGDLAVHGCQILGAAPVPIPDITPALPHVDLTQPPPDSWRKIYLENGPAALAKAIREHKSALITDTTWRDAHQSHLATRMRTYDMSQVAPHTARLFSKCFSLEMWGGATFDVCLRFLKEDPWRRLKKLRKQCPNILFQMLLRGANAVGYKAYPDNVIFEFVREAKERGIDVFRVFDSLNDIENLKIGIEAVLKAGGICEAAICYTGNIEQPGNSTYTLQYFLNLAKELVGLGIHILCIKDMAGLLRPGASKMLVGALRKEHPNLPIHLHTHDTAGTGVATLLAAVDAGVDVIDTAIDCFSGMTSQPSMGAVVNALAAGPYDTGLNPRVISDVNEYWGEVRQLYAPFESGMKSGASDVYFTQMPGGQYTNLLFQSNCLGLEGQWSAVKKAYIEANQLLGDIPKVTPSSKVVGDLAQFLVSNDLSSAQFMESAPFLSLPTSVVDFFLGNLGTPPNGFPEPLASIVRKGKAPANGRPGASLEPVDFEKVLKDLKQKYGDEMCMADALSYTLYPEVFDNFQNEVKKYGDLALLPTRAFLRPLEVDKELEIRLKHGRVAYVALVAMTELPSGRREVYFTVNGNTQIVLVDELEGKADAGHKREKAVQGEVGSVGAPMSGQVVEVRVQEGQYVHVNDPLVVLTAMKMETVVSAPLSGMVERVCVVPGDSVSSGDLVVLVKDVEVPVPLSPVRAKRDANI